ncbi:Vitamin K-dependent protein C (Fragment) [Seminavis robusta]|uniref:Vitamin K-dependent protein C n=1 Tax=Seminavis robusta TaxID=568900 RepID=A0A9N8DPW9_9STRA
MHLLVLLPTLALPLISAASEPFESISSDSSHRWLRQRRLGEDLNDTGTTGTGTSWNGTSFGLSDQRDLIINEKPAVEKENEIFNPLTLLEISGHRVNATEYPFFAHWSKAYCGASLVAPDILLTAAHCGSRDNPLEDKIVRMISSNRLDGGIRRVVVHQETHPDYNHELHVWDFQLLKLEKSALVTRDGNRLTGAKVVPLNEDYYYPPVGTDLTALGFGTTTPDGSTGPSNFLMDVQFKRFPNHRCELQYGPKRIPSENMLCMGEEGGGKDVCQGDSGGPIVDEHGMQVAVVSWGHGCGEASYFGANARVSAATEWIHRQICRLSSYPPNTCSKGDMISAIHRIPVKWAAKNLQTPNTGTTTLTVTVKHDKYPKETAWDLLHLDSWVQLDWQSYALVTEPFTTVSKSYPDLPGGTYQFRIGDKRWDGMCCKYGQGSIAISVSTPTSNRTLWQHDGNFSRFLQYTFELSDNATLVWKEETQTYTSPSMAATKRNNIVDENNPMKNDVDWPGVFPLQSEPNAMSVNVRHDDFPKQVEWAVWWYKPKHEESSTAHTSNSTSVEEKEGLRHLGHSNHEDGDSDGSQTMTQRSQDGDDGKSHRVLLMKNEEGEKERMFSRRELDDTVPGTSAPVSAAPITGAPVTASPVSSAPISHPPVTSAPVSSAPITQQPITQGPITSSPISSSPVTGSPVTALPASPVSAPPVSAPPVTAPPVSASPITGAPITAPPITSPPVTAPPVTAPPTGSVFRDGENTERSSNKDKKSGAPLTGDQRARRRLGEMQQSKWFHRDDARLAALRRGGSSIVSLQRDGENLDQPRPEQSNKEEEKAFHNVAFAEANGSPQTRGANSAQPKHREPDKDEEETQRTASSQDSAKMQNTKRNPRGVETSSGEPLFTLEPDKDEEETQRTASSQNSANKQNTKRNPRGVETSNGVPLFSLEDEIFKATQGNKNEKSGNQDPDKDEAQNPENEGSGEGVLSFSHAGDPERARADKEEISQSMSGHRDPEKDETQRSVHVEKKSGDGGSGEEVAMSFSHAGDPERASADKAETLESKEEVDGHRTREEAEEQRSEDGGSGEGVLSFSHAGDPERARADNEETSENTLGLKDPDKDKLQKASKSLDEERDGESIESELEKSFSFGDFLFGSNQEEGLLADDEQGSPANGSSPDVFATAENVKTGNASVAESSLQPAHIPPKLGNSTGLDPSKHKWTKLWESGKKSGLSNTLETRIFYHLKPGLYAFILRDSKGDGICCAHRFGWLTILGNQTIAWSNNGEFKEKVQVIVELRKDGTFKVIETTIDGKDASGILQPHLYPPMVYTNTTNVTIVPAEDEVFVAAHHNETRR